MTRRRLTEKQIKIIRQLRMVILDILNQTDKTPGKTLQVSDLYAEIAQHFSSSVDKIVALGNDFIWSALYLIELQGWIRLDPRLPRIHIVRRPQRQHYTNS